MAAPLSGIGPWDEIVRSSLLWHFNFRGPDVERLAEGRERIYLDRFWNELSANPAAIDEESCQRYAKLYARPGAMHSAFEQFAAFHQDAIDNRALDVTEAVIPNSGHWLMEEQPAALSQRCELSSKGDQGHAYPQPLRLRSNLSEADSVRQPKLEGRA